jgi:hypothetical protein
MLKHILSLVVALCLVAGVRAQVPPPVLGISFVDLGGRSYTVNTTFTPALSTGSGFLGSGYNANLTTTQANGSTYSNTAYLPPNSSISTFSMTIPGSAGFAAGDSATVAIYHQDIFGHVSFVSSATATYGVGSGSGN